jgi:4-amino-4-deoxy-L-arabinose transferase-like glycosyltransferase
MTATLTPPARAADPPAPPIAPARRPPRLGGLVLAALVVGLVVRVAVGLTDDAASTDETAYLHSGLAFVQGDGFERYGQPELHFPPFLPVLLGVASWIVADSHTGTVALTVVSGTLLIIPLSLLGRRLAGPAGGVATAWLAALVPGLATMPQIRGTGSETEYALLVVTAVWLVVSASDHDGRARLARVAGAGALVGLAYLTRPEGLLMVVPLGLAVLVLSRRSPPRAATVAAFAVPVLLCVVPYATYLHANTGRWELTAKTQDASIEAWAAVARGDRATRNGELYGLDETGLRFAAEYTPLTTLAREHPDEYRHIVGTNVTKLRDVVNTMTVVPLALWLVAAAGAWRFRRSRTVWLLLAVGALPVLSSLAFFVQQRYLVVTIALATVLMGAALSSIRSPRLGVAATVAVLAVAVFATVGSFRGNVAGWWHPVEQTEQRVAGEWLAAHSDPDARVMTRSMIVEFYAERPSVAMPAAGLDEVLRFARHYGVDYLVADWYTVDRLMPELGVLMDDDTPPGLRLVHEVRAEGREARIFALDPPAPGSTASPPPLAFTGDGS